MELVDDEECVADLDPEIVSCVNNTCDFPSTDNWSSDQFDYSEECVGDIKYWHICYDCLAQTSEVEDATDYPYDSTEYPYDYYYYFQDMYHPQHTKRYDVEGNEDISCDGEVDIQILGLCILNLF